MRLVLKAVRIVSFSALLLAVLPSAAPAEELTDARMDQITAGGFFELTADQLDSTTNAPQHNVIGGVGIMLEQLLSETFRSQQSLLADLGAPGAPPGGPSPPGGNLSPPGGNLSPPGGNLSPPGGNLSPPGGNLSPPGGNLSPPGGNLSPPGGNLSPRSNGSSLFHVGSLSSSLPAMR